MVVDFFKVTLEAERQWRNDFKISKKIKPRLQHLDTLSCPCDTRTEALPGV